MELFPRMQLVILNSLNFGFILVCILKGFSSDKGNEFRTDDNGKMAK